MSNTVEAQIEEKINNKWFVFQQRIQMSTNISKYDEGARLPNGNNYQLQQLLVWKWQLPDGDNYPVQVEEPHGSVCVTQHNGFADVPHPSCTLLKQDIVSCFSIQYNWWVQLCMLGTVGHQYHSVSFCAHQVHRMILKWPWSNPSLTELSWQHTVGCFSCCMTVNLETIWRSILNFEGPFKGHTANRKKHI